MSALDVESLRERVQKALDAFFDRQAPVLDDIGEALTPVLDVMADLLAGGKRLRPAFCYWGWRGAGGPDCDPAIAAAASLELLHACALVHDDVMDESDTRRGRPSVHRRFRADHSAAQWPGPRQTYGTGAAILVGDLALAWADELLFSSGLHPEALLRAKPVYDAMRTELMAGQYLDLLEQARGDGSVTRAMRVVRYKAAKYTVERPLHLGATLAGAPDELLATYSAYGLPLGEAFQLRDDILGVFGDPFETGKPAGDDLREGKATVLLAVARERASGEQSRELQRLVGDPRLDERGVAALRDVIIDTGALHEVERLIATLTEQAVQAIDRTPEPARQVLVDLAAAATARRT